jgi:hypothetical protein
VAPPHNRSATLGQPLNIAGLAPGAGQPLSAGRIGRFLPLCARRRRSLDRLDDAVGQKYPVAGSAADLAEDTGLHEFFHVLLGGGSNKEERYSTLWGKSVIR